MKVLPLPEDFNDFRITARSLLNEGAPPSLVDFRAEDSSIFKVHKQPLPSPPLSLKITKERLRWLQNIAMFRSDDSWNLLYRLLWKVMGNYMILENPADPDVIEAERRAKQVSRDIHKMHAFVRFNKMEVEGNEYFVAWHRPQHKILKAGSSFFKHRFGAMRWSILTPDESAHWDLKNLNFGPGVSNQPDFSDPVVSDWLTYYESIFNPARIKIKAMKKEMPVKYWESMPETRIISRLLAEAPERVEKMKKAAQPRADIPPYRSLTELSAHCQACKACPIACLGGKAVFGEGSETARIVLVGEQPGDTEDTLGRPFLGPAGELLQNLLNECNIRRSDLYITNAVKHFKWTARDKRRLHQKPDGSDILACKPWLTAELGLIKPEFIVCLGATAAQSVLGIKISIADALEEMYSGPNNAKVFVTYHPAAALRAPEQKKSEIITDIRKTLMQAIQLLNSSRDNHFS